MTISFNSVNSIPCIIDSLHYHKQAYNVFLYKAQLWNGYAYSCFCAAQRPNNYNSYFFSRYFASSLNRDINLQAANWHLKRIKLLSMELEKQINFLNYVNRSSDSLKTQQDEESLIDTLINSIEIDWRFIFKINDSMKNQLSKEQKKELVVQAVLRLPDQKSLYDQKNRFEIMGFAKVFLDDPDVLKDIMKIILKQDPLFAIYSKKMGFKKEDLQDFCCYAATLLENKTVTDSKSKASILAAFVFDEIKEETFLVSFLQKILSLDISLAIYADDDSISESGKKEIINGALSILSLKKTNKHALSYKIGSLLFFRRMQDAAFLCNTFNTLIKMNLSLGAVVADLNISLEDKLSLILQATHLLKTKNDLSKKHKTLNQNIEWARSIEKESKEEPFLTTKWTHVALDLVRTCGKLENIQQKHLNTLLEIVSILIPIAPEVALFIEDIFQSEDQQKSLCFLTEKLKEQNLIT